jgi:hypothetical protein
VESPLPDDIAESITRCIEAMSDLDRLRDELHGLRVSSDPRAQFATALFDLDRARRGDPQARSELIDVADRLLVFWRQGSGGGFAVMHPQLEDLWASATSLLISFEQKRFTKALAECWEHRANTALLQQSIEGLQPSGNRRVEFARCLYHLELARQFINTSRAEFASRAGLLSEAYQSEDVAKELIGKDQGLDHLWHDLKPYLDEFFEMMEEEAARRERAQALLAAEAEIALRRTHPSALEPTASPPILEPVRTDPLIEVPVEFDVDVKVEVVDPQKVPSFLTLMSGVRDENPRKTPLQTVAVPPAPPPNTTPPGSWFPPAGITTEPIDMFDVIEAVEAAAPLLPPAPPDLTPPGAWMPSADGDIEIVEADEGFAGPPPPPPMTPAQGIPVRRRPQMLDIVLDEDDPDQATVAFWQFATKSLDLLPDPRQPREVMRLLNVENRGDRKKLTGYIEAAEPYARQNADARAFSCLLRLMLAGQLKEKSLFGQPNARRAEAFAQAFALLSTNPRAAGHGAVWFEMDGVETMQALQRGLEMLMRYVSWCARERRDPLEGAAQAEFLGSVNA